MIMIEKMSIRWKLLFFLLLLVIIPLLFAGFLINRQNYKNIKLILDQTGQTDIKIVKDKLKDKKDRLSLIGERLLDNDELLRAIKREDPTSIYVKMNKVIKSEGLDFLSFVLPNGKVVRRGNNSREYGDRLPFDDLFNRMKEKKSIVTDYVTYPVELFKKEDTAGKKVSKKLVLNGQLNDGLAIVSVVPVEFFGDIVGTFVLGEVVNNNLEIYNKQLESLIFNNKSKSNITSFSGLKFDKQYIISANKYWNKEEGSLSSISTSDLNNKYLLYESSISNLQNEDVATIVYGIPKRRLDESKKENILITIKIVISIIIFVLLISTFFTFKISNKVSQITTKFEKIADGDLTTRLEINSKDELGELQIEFNETIRAQNEILKRMMDHIDEVSAYSEELAATSEEGSVVTESTLNNINQISEAISQIATSSEEVANLAQRAYKKTDFGRGMIDKVMKRMEGIGASVKNTEDVISSLDTTSQQINQIVEMITQIAEQTNLLALNASIEAARAGEAGQGFAVVAEEIKGLADETTEATKKAVTLIKETQSKSSQGLKAIKRVVDETESGKELIKETGDAFEEIANVVEDTSAYTQEVTASTEELAANSEDVNNATSDLNNMVEEVSESSDILATMTNNLKMMINKYKL